MHDSDGNAELSSEVQVLVQAVLRELFTLLEEHPPVWYTEEPHNRALSAIMLGSSLPSLWSLSNQVYSVRGADIAITDVQPGPVQRRTSGEFRGCTKDDSVLSSCLQPPVGSNQETYMRSSLKVRMRRSPQAQSRRSEPDFKAFFRSVPGLYPVLTPDFEIVSANDAYLNATYKKNEEISGRRIFDVFPDNPNVAHVNAVGNLRSSLEEVLSSGLPHLMRLQRYDVTTENQSREQWVEKYWSPGNFPLFAPKSREITHIIHRVEDMTALVRLGPIPYLEDLLNDTLEIHTRLAGDVGKHLGWLDAAEENLFALTGNLEAQNSLFMVPKGSTLAPAYS